jgi:hypothetical protein
MMTGELSFRVQALLSIQRALWEMVTPNLRGVAIQPEAPIIRGRFLYENDPTNKEREIVAEVEAYVLADFDESVDVSFRAEHVPPERPRDLLLGEEWVYMRREFESS